MDWMKRLGRRVGAPWRRATLQRDIDDEIRLHIELETEERIRSGMTVREARRTALRDFGGVDRFRDVALLLLLTALIACLLPALRALRLEPMTVVKSE